MVFNPDNGDVYRPERRGTIPTGHYGLRADDFDGRPVDESPVDEVELARRAAFDAAVDLNMTPREQRTPEAVAEAMRLSKHASTLATKANAELVSAG